MSDLRSKGGATIEKGDTVNTPVCLQRPNRWGARPRLTMAQIRGGKHEGEVSNRSEPRSWLTHG